MNRRFLIRLAVFTAIAWLVLASFRLATLIVSHFPPFLIPLDGVIIFLTRIQQALTFPRWALRHLWLSETTPAALNWLLGFANNLAWGLAFAALKTWRDQPRH